MKYIFATTALASALAFGTFAAGNLAKAEDTNAPPCVGEQCPQGGGMKGGGEQMPGMKGSGEENQGGYKKRLRGTGQNNQVEDQSAQAGPSAVRPGRYVAATHRPRSIATTHRTTRHRMPPDRRGSACGSRRR